MLFNTAQYLLFLPAVILLYYLLPHKVRYLWLLMASYYFYMQWNPWYALLLLACTAITWTGGLILAHQKNKSLTQKVTNTGNEITKSKQIQKTCLIICICLNLGMLAFFKYSAFALQCIHRLSVFLKLPVPDIHFSVVLPVGISFFILQSLGYLIDVYREDIYAERNFFRYALFISFFPQLVAGPIERSKNLLIQLHTSHRFTFYNLKKGILLIIYGLFLKVVIADRTAILVNTVFEDTASWPGFYIIVAMLFFSVQIYCDFYGYSTIARGSALIMGISLMDNFNAPYFSRNIKEFWQRWHISLSGWFRDYLYIPLGGNRKGFLKKEQNLLTIFAVSGLWHGASWGFIFWGILHAFLQIAADLRDRCAGWIKNIQTRIILPDCRKEKEMAKQKTKFSISVYQTGGTFLLVSFAWLFFRAGGLTPAFDILKAMTSVNNWTILLDGSLYNLGIAKNHMHILLLSILALFVIDYHKYHKREMADMFLEQDWFFQSLVSCVMLFIIMLYGCYGTIYDTQQFIYFQF